MERARVLVLEQRAIRDQLNEDDARNKQDWRKRARYGERRAQKRHEIMALKEEDALAY